MCLHPCACGGGCHRRRHRQVARVDHQYPPCLLSSPSSRACWTRLGTPAWMLVSLRAVSSAVPMPCSTCSRALEVAQPALTASAGGPHSVPASATSSPCGPPVLASSCFPTSHPPRSPRPAAGIYSICSSLQLLAHLPPSPQSVACCWSPARCPAPPTCRRWRRACCRCAAAARRLLTNRWGGVGEGGGDGRPHGGLLWWADGWEGRRVRTTRRGELRRCVPETTHRRSARVRTPP